MKLDRNKPYGEIFGHSYALYEQNGILFDGAGAPLEEQKPVEVPLYQEEIKYQGMQSRDFLNGLLKEGPLLQSAIYKEAENNNQNWEAVKQAFTEMGGQTFKQRNGFYWKLKTE